MQKVSRAVAVALAAAGLTRGDTSMPTSSPTITLVCEYDNAEGDTPQRNTDDGISYALGLYGNGRPFGIPDADDSVIPWPYAINQCTATAPVLGAYGKFTCESETVIILETFDASDNNCEDAPVATQNYTAAALAPYGYSFDCSGSTDSGYVAIDFGLGDCTVGQHTYGVVNVCGPSRMPDTFISPAVSYVFCDADGAKIEAFDISADQCSDGDYCADLVVENSCAKVFQTAAAVFGKMDVCMSNEKDNERDDGDAATHVSAALSLAVSALFSIALLF